MRHLALPFAIFTVFAIIGALDRVRRACWSRRTLWSGAGLAAIALAGSTLFAGTLKPEYARIRSMKTFATQVHRRVGNAPIYIAWGHDYELSFYYGRGIWGLDHTDPKVLTADLAARRPVYVVARPRELMRIAPDASRPAETCDPFRPGRRLWTARPIRNRARRRPGGFELRCD